MGESVNDRALATALNPPQLHAARYVVARVRGEVDAQLVQASLFGSRARGEARSDSDVDLLLVFRSLPPDREPFATQAENIAEEEAARTRVPVTVWSVSLMDLAQGQRTPMLVDALEDSIPIWWSEDPLPTVPFTLHDAVHCVEALLRRVEEGSLAVQRRLARGRHDAASWRIREDLVRVCTAQLLLSGITRPRRTDAVLAVLGSTETGTFERAIAGWVERSFGSNGTDGRRSVSPPPGGCEAAARLVEELRREAIRRLATLHARLLRP